MASITGLKSGNFTDIDVIYSIAIDGDVGQNGQVLSSDGTNTLWINGSSIDREDLTAADTTITISGDGTYDGQVAKTIQTNKVPNTITFANDGSGSRTGTFDGSSAITIDNTDTQLTLTEGSGIVITDIGGSNRRIAANIDADTIVFSSNEITCAKVPNSLTFTGYDTGTYDGSSALTIDLVNTEYTAGNGIQISGSNQIQTKTDNQTIRDSGGGSGNNLEVIKVPNSLTFTGYDTGTFDGSSALTINLVDTDTQLNLTEGNGITITNTGGVNRTIAMNADGTTLSSNVGSGQAGVLKVPNSLTAGDGLELDSGTTFDGSDAKTIKVENSIRGWSERIFFEDTGVGVDRYLYQIQSGDWRPNDDSTYFNIAIEDDLSKVMGRVRPLSTSLEAVAIISIPDGWSPDKIYIDCRNSSGVAVSRTYTCKIIQSWGGTTNTDITPYPSASTNSELQFYPAGVYGVGTSQLNLMIDVNLTSTGDYLGGGYIIMTPP